ncbi:PP2C family protein-serine/threonine phosphatase [Aporhodopirellula aestuarii]|uniref:SpoIIE family protein phosphatase n=1 Tax=Aporhodopirellula aestuarii TaxID=2950107 RepID=A0ABT0U390_9BACT|nr:SpoIIE family protein phosphatase [Aporhodopirellula aestuarii]MCM2371369.1 SpoIIE family protein phosphatase [Aporhodopirellula aestuarii]
MTESLQNRPKKSYTTLNLLLLAVNIPLVLLVGLLMVTDYRREMRQATDARRMTLSDEASLIGEALLKLSDPEDEAAIAAFLQSTCSPSAATNSAVCWIHITWNGRQLHTHTTPGTSNPSEYPNQDAIVGRFSTDQLDVQIIELAADIKRSVRGKILMHVSWLFAFASLAALILDVVLVRLIATPTKRLAASVNRVGSQRFDLRAESFRSHELNELSSAIADMAASLHRVEANRAVAMKRAEQIQRNLLPKETSVPGLEIVPHYQPAEEVAGDIYGVLELRDGSWLIYVADLVGHGVPAAMSASILKMIIDSAVLDCTDPGVLLEQVNEKIPRYLAEDGFATAVMLRWQVDSHQLTVASAGHEPLLLVRGETLESIGATGLPLGIDTSLDWTTETIRLEPGDRLFLLTDGISEAANDSDEMFGRERIEAAIRNNQEAPIEETVTHLIQQVTDHVGSQPAQDDITLLAIQCHVGD